MNESTSDLYHLLRNQGYKKITFKISKTQHLLLKVRVNGVLGDFILDTGASTSCIDVTAIEYFNLIAISSSTTASGAGAINMETQLANNNTLKMGRWKALHIPVVVFDLSHVNAALAQYDAKPVHGIIGADVLLKAHAIIDYANKKLFLK